MPRKDKLLCWLPHLSSAAVVKYRCAADMRAGFCAVTPSAMQAMAAVYRSVLGMASCEGALLYKATWTYWRTCCSAPNRCCSCNAPMKMMASVHHLLSCCKLLMELLQVRCPVHFEPGKLLDGGAALPQHCGQCIQSPAPLCCLRQVQRHQLQCNLGL